LERSAARVYFCFNSLNEQPDPTTMAEVDEDKAMETSGVERERPLTNVETLKNASGKSCLAKTLNRRDCPLCWGVSNWKGL
jgi:hypothetical protein